MTLEELQIIKRRAGEELDRIETECECDLGSPSELSYLLNLIYEELLLQIEARGCRHAKTEEELAESKRLAAELWAMRRSSE